MLCALQETLSHVLLSVRSFWVHNLKLSESSVAETVSLRYRRMQVRHTQGNDGSL